MMISFDEHFWSRESILQNSQWAKLRLDAKSVLCALEIDFHAVASTFDLNNLIELSEFRASNAVRDLLT
jgi:hypothetical protein